MLRRFFATLFWRARPLLPVALVFVASLAVRLVWNLKLHPPMSFAFSDMAGYIDRANEMFDHNWVPRPHVTLFPWGTHVFVFVLKVLFGKDNAPAIGVAFAVLGALGVTFTYAAARRLYPQRRLVTAAVGILLVAYYPWISLSSYVLSEPGFTCWLAASVFFSLRLADEGRASDAWLFGISSGLALIFRPQMALSLVFVALHFLFRRRAWRGFRRRNLVFAGLPIFFFAALSIARIHFHNGHLGLVSTNGPLNFAFGRCHCTSIDASARDGSSMFGPPPFGSLAAYEKTYPDALFRLAPAKGMSLKIRGHMWDAAPLEDLARSCVQATGYGKQLYYAATHVVLLWGYNVMWPDMGQSRFRNGMLLWGEAHTAILLMPFLFGLARSFRRLRARELLVGLHVFALVVTAIIYFGDTRFRAPYDGIIILLALPVYADSIREVVRLFRDLRWPSRPATLTQ